LDAIEDEVKEGGYIIDWHACDLFPRSWIDLVVVLRVKSETLYDRLKERSVHCFELLDSLYETLTQHRKYPDKKLQENLDSEIMEVLLQEAHDSYDAEIIVELRSDTAEELDANIDRIEAWVKQWKIDRNSDP
jgi:adenylate kinase